MTDNHVHRLTGERRENEVDWPREDSIRQFGVAGVKTWTAVLRCSDCGYEERREKVYVPQPHSQHAKYRTGR